MIKLFLILIVGYCCQKWRVLPEGSQAALTRLVLYVTTPCMILDSVFSSEGLPDAETILLIFLVSLACYAVAALLAAGAVRLLRIAPGKRGVYAAMMIFSNCGFIGYPVVQTIFGDDAVFYTSVFNIPYNLLIFTLGVWLMQRDCARSSGGDQKMKLKLSDLLSPCLVASALAIVLALTKWSAPGAICDTVGMIGNITTPVSLLVIGISIARQPLKNMLGSPRLYVLAVLRLMVIPAVIWAALRLFVADALLLGVAVVVFGMPVATMVPMLAGEHGADDTDAVRGVFLTTVLSMITIPLLVTVLM